MRRGAPADYIKNTLLLFFFMMAFLIFLPLIIVGTGGNRSGSGRSREFREFDIKASDLVFNDNNGGPLVSIYITDKKKVVEMYLEEYIIGVVSAEMPASFEMEALKAQAVAARTFALSHIPAFGGWKCSRAEGADLCDTVHCQAYIDKYKRLEGWPKADREFYWNKITEAVQETSGEILTYEGKLVMNARYFAISGGKTENASEVLSIDEPYLKSVSSPEVGIAPNYSTTIKIKNTELARKINTAYPEAKLIASRVKNDVKIISRTSGGSVREIKVGQTTISGAQFRSALSLRSANFELKFGSSDTEITCYGYGHGIGMSQWGARVMAQEGKSYTDILTHYYQGVEIDKLGSN
jgi:stage II sporulation protein D